ncbi:hypothetical protein SVIO_026660 [Streptomyces violaceusniger]|uniref:Integrase catalytic domain-containing protein n=1 Tax=Streptomyces violaceusniger TaxID=68280 RepID=A0A4D4L223_STRVO|nr:hypothetical protein SVIO_026660 [Streptomyces violaceusniger]
MELGPGSRREPASGTPGGGGAKRASAQPQADRACDIGLAGVRLRRRHRTTVAGPAAAKAPDLIGRDFTASEPNTKYVGDITYLPLDSGKFLYLATVIDLASRRLDGWAIVDTCRVLQRDVQTRDASGPQDLVQRTQGPPRRVPLAQPLQHPTPSLPPRTTQSHRLRDSTRHNINDPGPSRIARIQDCGSRPVALETNRTHLSFTCRHWPHHS